ncbi:helix-turn-helix domain-containing protein [Paenibacillus sp. HJGM_3]|uniref:AraC family transcriptional regulator n=1 Tax=Paenibacillus sp. HJGM_3 TaxID=3379816 RepID=UPI00385D20B7
MQVLEMTIPPLPQLLTVGHAVWRAGDQHFRRRFGLFDVLFIVRGTLHMTEEGQPYDIQAGQLLILEAGLEHWGHRSCSEPTEIFWLHLRQEAPYRSIPMESVSWSSMLPQGTDRDLVPNEQHVYLPKYAHVDMDGLLPLLKEMVEIHRTLCRENAMLLHAKLAELLVRLQQGLRNKQVSRSMSMCEQLKKVLHRRFREPFDAGELERELHYNFDYAARCLKRHTGMSPLKYQHYLRIEEAKRLLRHSSMTVGEIGAQVGYADDNYFIRMFRRTAGLSPGAYRQADGERHGFEAL